MAWLHATPKPPDGSIRAKMTGLPALVSRMEQAMKSGVRPKMPPNPLPHVIDRLVEMGLTEAAGMGTVAISWQTLAAWSSMTGIVLAPWEARLIRTLSAAYLAESRGAESENCPAPWRPIADEHDRHVEQCALEAVLG